MASTKDRKQQMRDEYVATLREEVRRNLGCRIAKNSTIRYERGWYYVNLARRFDDGSVGIIGFGRSMRETEFVALILHHRQEARRKNQGAAIRSFDALRRRLRDLDGQQERAAVDDDPQGSCAAYHRGARYMLQLILAEVTPKKK
jgi:hypothetical protein